MIPCQALSFAVLLRLHEMGRTPFIPCSNAHLLCPIESLGHGFRNSLFIDAGYSRMGLDRSHQVRRGFHDDDMVAIALDDLTSAAFYLVSHLVCRRRVVWVQNSQKLLHLSPSI